MRNIILRTFQKMLVGTAGDACDTPRSVLIMVMHWSARVVYSTGKVCCRTIGPRISLFNAEER